MERSEIERISLEVMASHGCHTVVLYGSYARDETSPTSDLDLLCVRESGPKARDARILDGLYVDAFIYPEVSIASPEPGLLRVLGGTVLHERDRCGTTLLANLQALYDRGPAPLPGDERDAILLWPKKMMNRIRGHEGLEANYRRMQLLTQSLEDYFALRGLWFLGPKVALTWLRDHDAKSYEKFVLAAQGDASDANLADLVGKVYGPFLDSQWDGDATRGDPRSPR